MYYFVEISCVIAEMWLTYFLLSGMFQRRKIVWWLPLLEYTVVGTILSVLSLLSNMTFVRIGFSLFAVWIIGMTVFQTDAIHSAFSSLIMCALVALADVLTSLALRCCGIETQNMMTQGAARSVYLVADHIVLFALVVCVFAMIHKTGEKIALKILIPLVPCWSVSILLCVILAWQMLVAGEDVSALYFVVLVGMLYTNIVVIYFMNRLSVQEREKREQEIAEHHYAMQQEYYDQFRVQQEETRALWHDISKFLRAAKAEGSGEALLQVEQMLDSISTVVDVDNRVISVILNEYAQIAKNADIKLNLDVQIPRELFVTAADLYVIIGNTMENAIEACASLPQEQRKITMKLKTHNSILFYEIENPYAESHLKRIRGKMHGYGLQNVERCVNKYSGTLDIKKEAGAFRLVAHLNSN